MASLSKIIVVGASRSGLSHLGSFIAKALHAEPQFEVTALARNSSKSLPEGVKVIRVDDSYPQDQLEKAFAGHDAVVMATNFQVFGQEVKFIDAAIKAGVKRFIPSEFGSNTNNKNTLAIFPMMGAKARVINELKAREHTGLSWTALCTGLFLDVGLNSGFVGFSLENHTATIWDDGSQKFSSTPRANVAQAVVGVLKHPDITANQYAYISSFETSLHEILLALEKAQGVKYTVKHVKTEDEVEDGKAKLASGDAMKAGKLVLAANLLPGYGNNFAKEERLWNDDLGVPREHLDAVVARIVQTGE
ncbi:hypothetical protein SLS53_002442 [Cytospora paraplurivora]|uniref:NmrA-like domain-containing protein n=1 Tax=Cytospora paraplurivora TaxID=2898453 RepID=A0AAN9UNR6_9PEZI